MSKKKAVIILVSALIISYFLSGVVYIFIFEHWSVRTILALITSFGVFLLGRAIIKKKYPLTYEALQIDENDERIKMLFHQATYCGFYAGLLVLMFSTALLYDIGPSQLQSGVIFSMAVLLITQVFGYAFIYFKNRS